MRVGRDFLVGEAKPRVYSVSEYRRIRKSRRSQTVVVLSALALYMGQCIVKKAT